VTRTRLMDLVHKMSLDSWVHGAVILWIVCVYLEIISSVCMPYLYPRPTIMSSNASFCFVFSLFFHRVTILKNFFLICGFILLFCFGHLTTISTPFSEFTLNNFESGNNKDFSQPVLTRVHLHCLIGSFLVFYT